MTPTHQEKESWEVEFDKEFDNLNEVRSYGTEDFSPAQDRVKAFIRHLRSQDLARLKGEVELMRKEHELMALASAGHAPAQQLESNGHVKAYAALSAVLEVIEDYQSKD